MFDFDDLDPNVYDQLMATLVVLYESRTADEVEIGCLIIDDSGEVEQLESSTQYLLSFTSDEWLTEYNNYKDRGLETGPDRILH